MSRYVVPATIMLSFVSFWRAAAPTDVVVHRARKLKRVDAVSLTRSRGEAEESAEFFHQACGFWAFRFLSIIGTGSRYRTTGR